MKIATLTSIATLISVSDMYWFEPLKESQDYLTAVIVEQGNNTLNTEGFESTNQEKDLVNLVDHFNSLFSATSMIPDEITIKLKTFVTFIKDKNYPTLMDAACSCFYAYDAQNAELIILKLKNPDRVEYDADDAKEYLPALSSQSLKMLEMILAKDGPWNSTLAPKIRGGLGIRINYYVNDITEGRPLVETKDPIDSFIAEIRGCHPGDEKIISLAAPFIREFIEMLSNQLTITWTVVNGFCIGLIKDNGCVLFDVLKPTEEELQ